MESGAQEREVPMPTLDGFGGLHECSMMKLLTSGMDDFPALEANGKEMKKHGECLRNHCASAGGFAIDGCGEFMRGGTEATLHALKCAACGCHRNFHRREADFGAHEGGPQTPMSSGSAPLHGSSQPKEIVTSNVTGVGDIRRWEAKVPKMTKYLECLKNHQVSTGGHAVDGCQEFIAGGEGGTLDALQCAACKCHRSFHRKQVEGEPCCDCHQIRDKETTWTSGAVPQTPLSYGPTDSDDQDGGSSVSAGAKKKRFRTKFSVDQTEKMRSYADKLGWTILKNDEGAAQAFCVDIGVSRQLFRVWMHNNKNKRTRE